MFNVFLFLTGGPPRARTNNRSSPV